MAVCIPLLCDMEDAISGKYNGYFEGSDNLLDVFVVVLPTVIIDSLKGNLIPFLLPCCRVCYLDAFTCVLKRKASVWGINSWKHEHGNFDNAPLIKCNLTAGIVHLVETFICT